MRQSTTKINYDYWKEDEAFCSCCEEGEFTEQNQILFCDGCDIGVHQECYHISHFDSEEQWFCQRCSTDEIVKCAFCPQEFQVIERAKINDTNYWVHSSCLRWHHNLVLNFQASNSYTSELLFPAVDQPCVYCHRSDGYLRQCNLIDCPHYFHIGCLKSHGGILDRKAMAALATMMQPYRRYDSERALYCVTHAYDLPNLDKDLRKKFVQQSRERVTRFFNFNRVQIENQENLNNLNSNEVPTNENAETAKSKIDPQQRQQQQPVKKTTQTRNFEDTLFDDMFQNKQFKELKVPINNKKLRQQFKDYMKRKLNEQLMILRNDFLNKHNRPPIDQESDVFIQLDIQLSKKLFDRIIDINDLEAFDRYLVSFLVYSNMVERFSDPRIAIRDDHPQAKYWKSLLDELHIKNGQKLAQFLNELRFKKMHVVSKKSQLQQAAEAFEAQLGVGEEPPQLIE